MLPRSHLECWRHFVLACRLLCQHKLSFSEIDLADALLIKFCKKVEHLYGTHVVTPNMYLHGHMKDVVLDYGPVQEFWLFSFERYNGILGKQPSNNREIESQLMQRFLRDNASLSLTYLDEFRDDFLLVTEAVCMNRVAGSVLDTMSPDDGHISLPTKYTRGVLTTTEIDVLKQLVIKITNNSCTKLPAVVLATWDENLYGSPPTQLPSSSLLPPTSIVRPVNIMNVSFTVGTTNSSLIFAHVSWFSPHPDRHAFGKPVELWCASLFESFGLQSFVPITNIASRCAHGFKKWHDEQLLVVVPLIE